MVTPTPSADVAINRSLSGSLRQVAVLRNRTKVQEKPDRCAVRLIEE